MTTKQMIAEKPLGAGRTGFARAAGNGSLPIGTIARLPEDAFPEVLCHDPALRRHLERPWGRAWVARELGIQAAAPAAPGNRSASLPESALGRSCLVTGTPGRGKSRFMELLEGQLLARGHSLVVLDPKLDRIEALAARAQAAGVPPERVTVISPRAAGGVPGWNPFLTDLPFAESAADFVALILRNSPSWGVQLGDTLTNAALLAAAHRLSIYELVRCLRDEAYRQTLLALPPPIPPSAAYDEAADFFRHEFPATSRKNPGAAVGPVTNKVRETLRNDFLRALLTARTNTLDFARLWKRQGVVLVHLDHARIGEDGARLLGGLVASSLYRTALRAPGPRPVTLALDELATAERFTGGILADIASQTRSYNLRVLAACQHLSQIDGPLRETLLSADVQVSFRLSPADARLVAASLAAGTEPTVARVRATTCPPHKTGGPVPTATWRHVVRDGSGQPLRLDPASWERLRTADLFGRAETDPLQGIYALAARRGVMRLYVRTADAGVPEEVRRYVAELSPVSYWVEGPAPLFLVVSFPVPRLTGVERRGEADAVRAWTRILQSLPIQRAVVRVGGGDPAEIRVADVPDVTGGDLAPYWAAALHANGQDENEVAACARARRDAAARLAGAAGQRLIDGKGRGGRRSEGPAPQTNGAAQAARRPLPPGGLADDGSLI